MNGVMMSSWSLMAVDDLPRIRKLKLADLNPHLMCVLCGGYFVDATTIIECLHSFCRTCIVKYLETSKYCPICDVQVHKTKPLLNIRSDQSLQDIVYKLVPGLFQREMRRRRVFGAKNSQENVKNLLPSSTYDGIKLDNVHRVVVMPDDVVSLSLEYSESGGSKPDSSDKNESEEKTEDAEKDKTNGRRYLKCPAAVTISHVKKLIRSKYELSWEHEVEILCEEERLIDTYTLKDVSYIYFWTRKGPMRLFYRIFSRPLKRQKTSHDEVKSEDTVQDQANIESEQLASKVSKEKSINDKEDQVTLPEKTNGVAKCDIEEKCGAGKDKEENGNSDKSSKSAVKERSENGRRGAGGGPGSGDSATPVLVNGQVTAKDGRTKSEKINNRSSASREKSVSASASKQVAPTKT